MPKLFDKYRMQDGITPLAAVYFNAIWRDVDNRIAALEALNISWEDAVAIVTSQGLLRIDAVLQPAVDAVNQAAADAQALLASLPDVATNAGVDAKIAAIPAPDTTLIEANISLNAFRIAVNGTLSVQQMVDGFSDVYTDESGVDTAGSVNQIYNAAGYLYSNAQSGVDLIPAMTSDTAPSGIASASSINGAGNEAFRAFDDVSASIGWYTANGAPTGWLAYDFQSPVTIFKYSITGDTVTSARSPRDWTFEGWNGSAWVVIDTQTGATAWSLGEKRAYEIPLSTYSKFRINVTANNGDAQWLSIVEMEMLPFTVNNMVLLSNAYTAVTQPGSGIITLEEEDLDSTVLNTDLIAAVSRDGGVTWTDAMLVNKSPSAAGRRILQGNVDLSAQPSGTSMKYKITTANAKGLKIHSAALSWK